MALPHDLYVELIQDGMPEGLSTEDQVRWIRNQLRHRRLLINEVEELKNALNQERLDRSGISDEDLLDNI